MNLNTSSKLKRLTNLVVLSFFIFACTTEEYVDVDVDPQLEITVEDQSGNAVSGASLKLYTTEESFLSNTNPVQTRISDASGKALFENLSEVRYYFYVEKGELNNFYEVVTFDEPLNKNEIRTISCIIR